MAKKGEKKGVKEAEVLKNQLARALADYDNLTRRVEKERQIIEQLVGLKIVSRLLPVYDMLTNAQKHLQDSGLAITIGQFEEALKAEGVEKISAETGDKFDPDLHEAVEAVTPAKEDQKGTLAGTVLDGWKAVGGPVIRHAKVKVYGEVTNKQEPDKAMSPGD